jgi:hypothetical protein
MLNLSEGRAVVAWTSKIYALTHLPHWKESISPPFSLHFSPGLLYYFYFFISLSLSFIHSVSQSVIKVSIKFYVAYSRSGSVRWCNLLPRGNGSNSHTAHGYKKELQKSVTGSSPQFFHFQFRSCSFIFFQRKNLFKRSS